MGKVPQVDTKAPSVKKTRRFRLGTRALREIRKFQKSAELLIPEIAFWWLVKEILQNERLWVEIQVGAVLALHKVVEAYLM